MTSPSLAFAIVEDKRQSQFIYKLLILSGIDRHRITIQISPAGRGSGKQWVRKQFPIQVEIYRKRRAKASTLLLAMMDADHLTLARCLGDLDLSLAASKQAKLDLAKDKVARLIPKWSIETWLLYLSSGGVAKPPIAEDRSYKDSREGEQWTELIETASKTFHLWSTNKRNWPEAVLDSLRHGLEEMRRTTIADR